MGGFGANCRVGAVLFFSAWITLAALNRLVRPVPNGCVMTYMYPTYIPISTPKNVSSDRYGLFLYHEGWKQIDFDEHVRNLDGVPVLFIPGNGGSYKQVRSLAAESFRAYQNGPLEPTFYREASSTLSVNELEDLSLPSRYGRMLDWFAVDLEGEHSAMDGRILEEHAEYVVYAIHRFKLTVHIDNEESRCFGEDKLQIFFGAWVFVMEILNSKGACFSSIGINRTRTNKLVKVGSQLQQVGWATSRACCEYPHGTSSKRHERYQQPPQNVDLPEIHPKNKKKPFPVPIKKMLQASRRDKKLAQMRIEKPLEPPKNGLLVPELVPVAYEVLDNWKVLIRGLSQLLNVVTVYGCRKCPQVHVGPVGHQIQDCYGTGSQHRNSHHSWVRGSINDVLIPIESYHLFDPFGRRVKHETRFDYDRIPAIVELCIQAGVDLPQYPSRRRTAPVRMIGKKVIDRGGFVDEPKPHRAEDCISVLAELDTFSNQQGQSPMPSNVEELAERTLKAYLNVRQGVVQLMSKYTVKACGYCSEVHVGPWGHNVKLCGAFKHQWRDGKHGWQDAVVDEVIPPNYVWHVPDPNGPPLRSSLRSFYGKAPAVVELCVQAGAEIPDEYRPMMRTDIVVPDHKEARMAA